MGQLENILEDVYGLSDLDAELKANKPSGVTNKTLDVYLDFFYNLQD